MEELQDIFPFHTIACIQQIFEKNNKSVIHTVNELLETLPNMKHDDYGTETNIQNEENTEITETTENTEVDRNNSICPPCTTAGIELLPANEPYDESLHPILPVPQEEDENVSLLSSYT